MCRGERENEQEGGKKEKTGGKWEEGKGDFSFATLNSSVYKPPLLLPAFS